MVIVTIDVNSEIQLFMGGQQIYDYLALANTPHVMDCRAMPLRYPLGASAFFVKNVTTAGNWAISCWDAVETN